MSENTPNEDSPAEAESRDASLKVDASSLQGEELDFAKMMGFGDSPEEESEAAPEPASASESAPEDAAAVDPEPEPDSETEAEAEIDAGANAESEADAPSPAEDPAPVEDEAPDALEEAKEVSEDAPEVANEAEPIAASTSEADDRTDWEEIAPRPSADGNQGLLQSRAREVLAYAEKSGTGQAGVGSDSPSPVEAPPPEIIAASAAPRNPVDAEPSRDYAQLHALEKERDALSAEFETLNTEHELLLDQQAALNGQLIRSNEEVERLQASLRAARTVLTPLPEGERALRAEVLGLRDRLEAAHAENHQLDVQCEKDATELAIAQARFEDRQHEVDVRLEEIGRLELELADAHQSAITQGEKQRELLELSTRLQAENNELRSAQIALEETLQARNLEISAREEHLAVTHEGLLSRDRQMIDLNALLEATRAELEYSETELARRDVEAEQNRRALERREVRIASLSETLANIDQVMGRPGNSHSLGRASSPAPQPSPSAVMNLEVKTAGSGSSSEESDSDSDSESDSECDPAVDHQSPESVDPTGPARGLLAPWRNGCLSEWMAPMGATTVADYFAAHLAQALDSEWPETLLVASLGGTQLDAEIRLVEAFTNRGVTSIEINVSDPDAQRAERRAQCIAAEGLSDQIHVRVGSLTDAESEAKAHAILFCDALFGHSEAALEVEYCNAGLSDEGLIFFADRIRGGAMTLSPETLVRLEEIWAVLPESLTHLPGFAETPVPGDDGGVLESAGPAIETLFAAFLPRADVGFGHLADLVVGAGRGAVLSQDDPATQRLLDSIFGLDESRSITEALPSRHGIGVFAKSDGSAPEPFKLFAPEWHVSETDED